MEGEHTPIIIRVILIMNHAWIQLKDSLEIPRFPTLLTIPPAMPAMMLAQQYLWGLYLFIWTWI